METNNKLEWRMYGLVPYNLSPIQQGIQFGHAVQEYNNQFNDDTIGGFFEWRTKDKTFIILNGGTTNYNKKGGSAEFIGSLNEHRCTLENHDIPIAIFNEPDLGDQLTAVVFLVDERVWDIKKYPNFVDSVFYSKIIENEIYRVETIHNPEYKRWVNFIGGARNIWLREFLKQFRLA